MKPSDDIVKNSNLGSEDEMEDDLLPLEDDTTEQPSSKSFFLTEAQCCILRDTFFFLFNSFHEVY